MPEGGPKPTLSPCVRAHLRTLNALHESLFAPQFRALETYGEAPPPAPSLADVVAAAQAALDWHQRKEIVIAAELSERREGGGNSILIDEAARALAYHRAERERISDELLAFELADVSPQAAE
jgi:hypothetical protein